MIPEDLERQISLAEAEVREGHWDSGAEPLGLFLEASLGSPHSRHHSIPLLDLCAHLLGELK